MRILMIHNSAAFGGAERYTVDVATGLVTLGHDISLIGSPGDPTEAHLRDSGARLHSVPMGMAIGWHAVLGFLNEPLFWLDIQANPQRAGLQRMVSQLHAAERFDVVHVQFIKERAWVGPIARSLGLPVVWTIHSPLEPWMTRGVAARIMQREAPLVDRVIAVSEATARDLLRNGVPAEKIDVVYNGLDLSRYAKGDRQTTRASFGFDEQLVVLVPARPYREKGIDVLLDAAVVLSERNPGAVKVLVAGESRHREAYEGRAKAWGLGDSVLFLGHRDDMPDLYAAADVVCLPSYYEGLPYAISEAMAAGRPVVGTPVGGVPEMVDDGTTGILVPVGQPEPLAEAIERLGNSEIRASMGAAGRERAQAMFSLEGMLHGTLAAYSTAIECRSLSQ